MGYCVISKIRKQIAWCNSYNSAYRMILEFGCDAEVFDTRRKIHREFVAQIRQSW